MYRAAVMVASKMASRIGGEKRASQVLIAKIDTMGGFL